MNTPESDIAELDQLAVVQFSVPDSELLRPIFPEGNMIGRIAMQALFETELRRAEIPDCAVESNGPLNTAFFVVISPRPRDAAGVIHALLKRMFLNHFASVWYFNAAEAAMFCLCFAAGSEGRPFDPHAALKAIRHHGAEMRVIESATRAAIIKILPPGPQP